MMDTDIDTFTCQKDGLWFPETISCSPRKCPLPANITHLLIHGDDFSVNKQVSVSCAEGYTNEGVNTSTCQVRLPILIRMCKCNSFICIVYINVYVPTQAVSCCPEKKKCPKFPIISKDLRSFLVEI